MKTLLLADDRLDLLAALEPILKHWGYRVLTATDAPRAGAFLASSAPAMLLVGSNLLNAPELHIPSPAPPLLVLDHPAAPPAGDDVLGVPVDIFTLFSFIQSRVEQHPRQNLRLRLRLPGMYRTQGERFVLAEVLSLSLHGLFFRSPLRLAAGDRVSAVFPLFGHGRELEIDGRVLYTVEPVAANNYAQGFGMGFDQIAPEQATLLGQFLEQSLLSEVSSHPAGVGTFSTAPLRR